MTALYSINWVDLASHAVPMIFLFGLATICLLADLWWREYDRTPITIVAVAGICFAAGLAWVRWQEAVSPKGVAMLYFDRITWMGGLILLLAALLTLIPAMGYLRDRRLPIGEFIALLLYGVVGMWLMIATTHLLMVFLGLETLSLAAYVLAGYHRSERRSIEASLKYFLLGAVAASFFLFGLAFLYGGTGALDLMVVSQIVTGAQTAINRLYTVIGVAFLLVGLSFKIAAVPFQFWVPDVYEGAPLPVTAFFATGVKAGAFIVLWRVADSLAPMAAVPWREVIWGLAVVTMTVGNLAALAQEDVKRMLAYSSIAHAGYALIAIQVMGGASLLLYLVAYTIMTIGAFVALMALGSESQERTALSHFTGLGSRRPWLAAAMAVFLLSLAGVPPTVGFFAKYYLFQSAIGAGQLWLVIIAVLNSVLSVAYYVRPIVAMYFRPAAEGAPINFPIPVGVNIVLVTTLVAVFALGLFPTPLLTLLIATVK